jgi:hypothetical protein
VKRAERMKKNTLKRGQIVTVYDDPLTEKLPCFQATLRTCRSRNLGVWEGRELQCWQVIPKGEQFTQPEIHEMNILAPKVES